MGWGGVWVGWGGWGEGEASKRQGCHLRPRCIYKHANLAACGVDPHPNQQSRPTHGVWCRSVYPPGLTCTCVIPVGGCVGGGAKCAKPFRGKGRKAISGCPVMVVLVAVVGASRDPPQLPPCAEPSQQWLVVGMCEPAMALVMGTYTSRSNLHNARCENQLPAPQIVQSTL